MNNFINAIRKHLEQVLDINQVIVWDVQLDESRDVTLLSQRVYGSREYAQVVMVACGTSYIWQPLPMKRIYLPKLNTVLALQRQFWKS